MSDISCPYCEHEQEINHDDGYGYEESVRHEQERSNCEKTFVFVTSISFDYEVGKADCLNGSDHEFVTSVTIPVRYTKMRCENCDETRPLTDKEWAVFGDKLPGRFPAIKAEVAA